MSGSTSQAPPPTGRAGRNLPAAIGVGAGLGGAVVASLIVGPGAFVVLVCTAVLVAVWEIGTALRTKQIAIPQVPLVIGAVAMPVAAWQGGTESLLVALALTVAGVIGWRLADGPTGFAADVSAGVFVAVYVPFLAGFTVLMDVSADGAHRVATYVVLVVCNDVGGYAAGVLFGRHPMAPRISPKKSWEGMAGSFLACAVGGALCVALLLDENWWAGALLGLAMAVASTLGDLGESVLKRDIGVKDMGTLLPGHGGLMDRMDSLLVAAPVAWLLLAWIAPPTGI